MRFTKERLIQIIKEELELAQEGYGSMAKAVKAAISDEPQMYAGEVLSGEALIAKIIADEFGGDVAAFDAAAKAYMDKKYPSQPPAPEMDPMKKFGPKE